LTHYAVYAAGVTTELLTSENREKTKERSTRKAEGRQNLGGNKNKTRNHHEKTIDASSLGNCGISVGEDPTSHRVLLLAQSQTTQSEEYGASNFHNEKPRVPGQNGVSLPVCTNMPSPLYTKEARAAKF
jgi:hypothetical protein